MIAAEIVVVIFLLVAVSFLFGQAHGRSMEKRLRQIHAEELRAKEDRITELALDNENLRQTIKLLKPPATKAEQ